MKTIFVVNESDEWNSNPNPIAYCTTLNKALGIVKRQLKKFPVGSFTHNYGDLESVMESLKETLQTQGLRVNFDIRVSYTNELIK